MQEDRRSLAQVLEARPRVALATLPTPLHEARRLREALGGPGRCPRILVKRDDLTGLAGGGNKARKLEFLVADAMASGATFLVTTGGVQSNHARMTAAAGCMFGLGTSLVLTAPTPEPEDQGNLLLDHLFGAEVHLVPAGDPALAVGPGEAEEVAEVVDELTRRGERPYVVSLGGSSPVGALGYVAGTMELLDQLAGAGEDPARLYVAAGSWGTTAGLVLGALLVRAPYRVHAVSVIGGDPEQTDPATVIAGDAAALLGRDVDVTAADLEIDRDQVGPGYGIVTPACLEAIELMARSEGIILDPVYTGKAMAGLIADVRRGDISASETVVFLHTGGLPGLFAHAADFAPGATSRARAG